MGGTLGERRVGVFARRSCSRTLSTYVPHPLERKPDKAPRGLCRYVHGCAGGTIFSSAYMSSCNRKRKKSSIATVGRMTRR